VSPEKAEEPTTHHGADNPQDDVQEKSFAALVNDFASDKPGDQAEYDPRDDPHMNLSS
jgi:hypothetical protein